ncbi:Ig-like domain-containing protein [Streptomyces sp. NPDC059740]|uniref:L,D-transpeptidase n=1 Tax=Streptomyces sp. NPDC059740 TaxID=3346926 RepID=UPI0036497B69
MDVRWGARGRERSRGVREPSGTGRGRAGRLAALLCGGLLLTVTACSAEGAGATQPGDGKGGSSSAAASPTASQAEVTVSPKDGSGGVATTGALKVTAAHGRLRTVKVTSSKGKKVAGRISGHGTLWEPTGHLTLHTRYAVAAIAEDSQGRPTTKHATFTTLKPAHTFVGTFTPENGQTVGVGMPVSLRFTRGITDPKAVEKAIRVTAKPSVPIAGHWFGNDRLDFRPEHYWKPGTKVTLSLALDGVEGRPDVFGTQAKKVSFTVGRSQISYVNASTHQMKVVRDGKTLRTVPVTAGSPGHDTWNGKMVISEKLRTTRMNSETVGLGKSYDIKDVPHAMRLSDSGTFIHGNYWAAPYTFGHANASHGCIGLRDLRGGSSGSQAGWFYANSLLGDVVEVSHSHDETVAPENGLNAWNMSWADWKAPQ